MLKSKISHIILLLIITVLIPIFVACQSTSTSPTPSAPPTVPQQKYLTVGTQSALSGFAAAWGTNTQRCVELLVDGINNAGGLNINGDKYLLKFISYDDKFDAKEGAIVANRLIHEDKVDIYIVGAGPAATAAMDVSNAAKKLQYGTSFDIHEPSPKYPLVFARMIRVPELIPGGIQWFAKNYPDKKRYAFIAANNPDGQGAKLITETWTEKAGLDLVAAELAEIGTVDFTPVLLKVLQQKPDIINLTTLFPDSTGTLAKQARDLGYHGILSHWSGPELAILSQMVGPEVLEGFLGGMEFGTDLPPNAAAFRDQYLEKYGPPFPSDILFELPGLQAFFSAIESAGTWESEPLAEHMRNGEAYDTALGKAHYGGKDFYGIDNTILYPMYIGQMQDGNVKLVGTIETGTYK
jgi:branched-chain amino acid transport system substrate-binding protein